MGRSLRRVRKYCGPPRPQAAARRAQGLDQTVDSYYFFGSSVPAGRSLPRREARISSIAGPSAGYDPNPILFSSAKTEWAIPSCHNKSFRLCKNRRAAAFASNMILSARQSRAGRSIRPEHDPFGSVETRPADCLSPTLQFFILQIVIFHSFCLYLLSIRDSGSLDRVRKIW